MGEKVSMQILLDIELYCHQDEQNLSEYQVNENENEEALIESK